MKNTKAHAKLKETILHLLSTDAIWETTPDAPMKGFSLEEWRAVHALVFSIKVPDHDHGKIVVSPSNVNALSALVDVFYNKFIRLEEANEGQVFYAGSKIILDVGDYVIERDHLVSREEFFKRMDKAIKAIKKDRYAEWESFSFRSLHRTGYLKELATRDPDAALKLLVRCPKFEKDFIKNLKDYVPTLINADTMKALDDEYHHDFHVSLVAPFSNFSETGFKADQNAFGAALGRDAVQALTDAGYMVDGKPNYALQAEKCRDLSQTFDEEDDERAFEILQYIVDRDLVNVERLTFFFDNRPLEMRKAAKILKQHEGFKEACFSRAERDLMESSKGFKYQTREHLSLVHTLPVLISLCEAMSERNASRVANLKVAYAAVSDVSHTALRDNLKNCMADPSYLYRTLLDTASYPNFNKWLDIAYLEATTSSSGIKDLISKDATTGVVKDTSLIEEYLANHAPLIGRDSSLYQRIVRSLLSEHTTDNEQKRSSVPARILGNLSALKRMDDDTLRKNIGAFLEDLNSLEIENSLHDLDEVTDLTPNQQASLDRCLVVVRDIYKERQAVLDKLIATLNDGVDPFKPKSLPARIFGRIFGQ